MNCPARSRTRNRKSACGREYRRGLRAQEIPPRRVGAPLGCRRDLQRLEDPADRRRAYPVADLEQLTLDPLVSPAVVLGGEPLDERGDLGAGRRPSRPVRIGPLPGDQAVTRRRCQRRTVPGVTSRCARSLAGRSRISAAITARSAQSSFGFGFCRRSTATSWRSTRSSASFKPKSVPATPSSQSGGRTSNRASVPSRTSDLARQTLLIVGKSTGQPTSRRFGTPQDGTGQWPVARTPSGITLEPGHAKADVAVRAPAARPPLLLTRCLPASEPGVEIFGEQPLLTNWLERTPF